jgi:hypothetical protein
VAATIHHPPVSDTDRPPCPYQSCWHNHPELPRRGEPGYMPPERFRQWRDALEFWAAARGLPPDPWPLP